MACLKIRTSKVEQGQFGGKEWLTQCLPSETTRERERERGRERENRKKKLKKKSKSKIYIYIYIYIHGLGKNYRKLLCSVFK
jgi:hypothetical protein